MDESQTETNDTERIADALERQNRLLEDRNAVLVAGFEALFRAMYDPERGHDPDARTPDLWIDDALFDLNYIGVSGFRTGRHPEQDEP